MPSARDKRLAEALRFFTMLGSGAPAGATLAVSAKLPEGTWVHHFAVASEPERAAKWALNLCDRRSAEVYARCTLLRGKPKRGRGRNEDTIGASVLWLDLDDTSQRSLSALQSFEPAPSAIHRSGHGFHVFWMLDAFCDDSSVIERANIGIIETLGLPAADRCWDASRILRVPGTSNFKGEEPLPVTVERWTGRAAALASFPLGVKASAATFTGDVAELAADFLSRLPEWLSSRIVSGEGGPEKSDGSLDRSANDWAIVGHLLKRGVSPAECIAVLLHPEWVSGAKARAGGGERYARATVSKALAAAAPAPSQASHVRQERHRWTGAEFMASHFTPPGWLIERIWLDETIGFLAGPPKVKKTWLALDLAFSVASQTPFLDEFEVKRRGTVILVQREDPEVYLQDRLYKIAVARGYAPALNDEPRIKGKHVTLTLPQEFPPLHIYTDPGFQLADPDSMKSFQEWVESVASPEDIRLVVLDPLLKFASGFDEYRATEVMDKVFKPLDLIRRRWQAACVVVHHESKRTESGRGGQRMYGSIALHAFAESALYVEMQSESTSLIKPEYKSAAAPPVIVTFGDFEQGYSVKVERVSINVELVATYLTKLSEPITSTELAKQFGMNESAMRKLLADGIKRLGTIVKLPGARRLGEPDHYIAAEQSEEEESKE